jgi:hypothetical protein
LSRRFGLAVLFSASKGRGVWSTFDDFAGPHGDTAEEEKNIEKVPIAHSGAIRSIQQPSPNALPDDPQEQNCLIGVLILFIGDQVAVGSVSVEASSRGLEREGFGAARLLR